MRIATVFGPASKALPMLRAGQADGQRTMAIEITKEQQRMIDLAVASGAFQSPGDVIGAALAMLHEEIEDGIISDARASEPRFALDEVEAELRALGKIK
jgi:Arc/MetJ-type ribon-helix-helix transcriptional regulator